MNRIRPVSVEPKEVKNPLNLNAFKFGDLRRESKSRLQSVKNCKNDCGEEKPGARTGGGFGLGGPLGDPLGASLWSLVSSLGLGIASRFRPQSCGLGAAFLGLGRGCESCDSCQSSSSAGRKMASRSGMSGWRPAASASFLRSCRARSACWAGALECRGGKVPPFFSKPGLPMSSQGLKMKPANMTQ